MVKLIRGKGYYITDSEFNKRTKYKDGYLIPLKYSKKNNIKITDIPDIKKKLRENINYTAIARAYDTSVYKLRQFLLQHDVEESKESSDQKP